MFFNVRNYYLLQDKLKWDNVSKGLQEAKSLKAWKAHFYCSDQFSGDDLQTEKPGLSWAGGSGAQTLSQVGSERKESSL